MSQNHDAIKQAFETYLAENEKFTQKGVKAAAAREANGTARHKNYNAGRAIRNLIKANILGESDDYLFRVEE